MASLVGVVALPDPDVWRGRRVLVTGHTGFKGAWMALWLERLGAHVTGLALPAENPEAAIKRLAPLLQREIFVDIRNRNTLAQIIQQVEPEVVFHLAAQALVSEGYRDPVATFDINVTGTVNVVSASAASGARAVVVVTSDKVYANDGAGRTFVESDPLGGRDPYSASKSCADIAARSFHAPVGNPMVAIAVARAGNVIGGGDVAPDRLLPDAWRAASSGDVLTLRNPDAVRPWQFVLEPLLGYLLLAERLLSEPHAVPVAVNFGPYPWSCRAVREVIEIAFDRFGAGAWRSAAEQHYSEATILRLDAGLAGRILGWSPRLGLEAAISYTVEWWQAVIAGDDVRTLALSQLSDFQSLVEGT